MANATDGRPERAETEKRARILAAARRRPAEVGYEGTTMASVAADVDVASARSSGTPRARPDCW